MQLGDVIVAVNDTPITTTDDLYQILSKLKVGNKVKVTYMRDERKQTVEVILEAL